MDFIGPSPILLLLVGFVYILPGVVASSRHKRNAGAIWTLNILLGWSVFGWVGALVWAMTHDAVVVGATPLNTPELLEAKGAGADARVSRRTVTDNKICPGCGASLMKEAVRPHHCGHDFHIKLGG